MGWGGGQSIEGHNEGGTVGSPPRTTRLCPTAAAWLMHSLPCLLAWYRMTAAQIAQCIKQRIMAAMQTSPPTQLWHIWVCGTSWHPCIEIFVYN